MRSLLLTRGAPGSGKSTWIRENAFEDYSINADKIRLLIQSPVVNLDGSISTETLIRNQVITLILFLSGETRCLCAGSGHAAEGEPVIFLLPPQGAWGFSGFVKLARVMRSGLILRA